ncbi:uncharacterized protein LOC131827778 isoform X2 [Mustela lutreola]|nr:uncharacterized protein LOC131827778 isoform X2 [Mustela lutreola]
MPTSIQPTSRSPHRLPCVWLFRPTTLSPAGPCVCPPPPPGQDSALPHRPKHLPLDPTSLPLTPPTPPSAFRNLRLRPAASVSSNLTGLELCTVGLVGVSFSPSSLPAESSKSCLAGGCGLTAHLRGDLWAAAALAHSKVPVEQGDPRHFKPRVVQDVPGALQRHRGRAVGSAELIQARAPWTGRCRLSSFWTLT